MLTELTATRRANLAAAALLDACVFAPLLPNPTVCTSITRTPRLPDTCSVPGHRPPLRH